MLKEIKKGFTLAEVLIVIGIIGVVAALTLPNLNHATGDKEKVTKVKKIYSALSDAVDRAQAIYGPFDTWFNDLSNVAEKNERFAKRITEFMKISKNCGFDEGCFSSAPLVLMDGSEEESNYLQSLKDPMYTYMVMLPDGISLGFHRAYTVPSNIKVDIDGPNKGKNQYGVDIFDFTIYSDNEYATGVGANINQLYPAGCPDMWTGDFVIADRDYQGNYVTAWVIENGNLDYLKCPDELNWETKTSCE